MAAAESPPPISEKAPFSVAATTAWAMAFVPFSKFSISKTPIGPFHRMVFESFIIVEKREIVLLPISSPIHPSGICPASASFLAASLSNLSAITLSTGSMSCTPLAFAFSISSRHKAMRSSSSKEVPIVPPCALAKV
ncbi:hypothetical protein D9M68_688920 [compost metagenome]